jgi:hypothetical protein
MECVYAYALGMREKKIMLCPHILKELRISALGLYYLVQLILKYILCDYDGWMMQHVSTQFVLTMSALCFFLQPCGLTTRSTRPAVLNKFIELHSKQQANQSS